jgi:hypothetical protein
MDLEELEIKSLFKQLEYLSSDIEYKEKYIQKIDDEFMEEVYKILNENEELNNLYRGKNHEKIEKQIKEEGNQKVIENKKNEKDPKVKSIFRDIVKITHPDKSENDELHDIYLKANKYYENNDLFSLYQLCISLGIKINIEKSEKEKLKNSIDKLKKRISFMENSYSWGWAKSDDENYKNQLILEFISKQI